MRQRGDGFGFALEPRQSIGVLRERRRQHLDRDIPIETSIARLVDLAHAARTERGHDLVRAETGSRGEGQMAASSTGILSRLDWNSGVITLRHLKAFQFSETKKPLRSPFCSEITTWTACWRGSAFAMCRSRMEMKMKFRLGIVAGLIGVTIGCSSYSPSTPSGGTGATGIPVSIVRNASVLTNTAYAPNPIAIGVGETITWINNDSEAHTSTGDDGSWNSGTIAAGASFSRTFPSAGTFAYHCTIHPNMIGTVTVR